MTIVKIDEPIVFDLPDNMRITVGSVSRMRDRSDARLAVWYEEQPYDGAAGATEISETPLGQFLLKHAHEL
jgi:hypothetical protein